jgi:hypothetical protein
MRFPKSFWRMGAMMLLAGIAGLQLAAAQQRAPQSVPLSRSPQANLAPVPLEKLTREQFHAMPPGALVIYKGRTMSKVDYMSLKMQEWAADKASPGFNTPGQSGPNLAKNESSQNAAADLAARNAQLQLEFEKTRQDAQRLAASPQYAVLAKEALDLRDRYKSASPEEKAKIKQRAAEVYSQLVQMEKNGAAAQR